MMSRESDTHEAAHDGDDDEEDGGGRSGGSGRRWLAAGVCAGIIGLGVLGYFAVGWIAEDPSRATRARRARWSRPERCARSSG